MKSTHKSLQLTAIAPSRDLSVFGSFLNPQTHPGSILDCQSGIRRGDGSFIFTIDSKPHPGYWARGGFQHLWQGRGWNPPLAESHNPRPGSPWTCLGGVLRTKPAPSSFWVTSSRFRLAAEAWSRGTRLSQSRSNWDSRDNHQKGWNTPTLYRLHRYRIGHGAWGM